MKKLLITSLLALSLAACATGPSAYGPAQSEEGLGFQTTKIENDRFRVSYTGRSDIEAQDYALLRAAEIAQAEGYSHFRVLTAETYKEGARRSGVSSSVGVSSGRGYYGGGTSVGVGISLNDLGRAFSGEKVTHNMEIRLLNAGSDAPNVYSAAGIVKNIQPESFK
jgi:opacity protein-like surface antigen